MGAMTSIDRRGFLAGTAMAVGALAVGAAPIVELGREPEACPPVVVFSKVYQELKLNFEASAAVTNSAGLAGVDAAVRPGGEVLPERVSEDLPRYTQALAAHGLRLPYVTTAIVSPATPHAEAVVRAARKAGATHYRIGFVYREPGAAGRLLREARAQLRDLAKLNREVGITAVVQNHSPAGREYLGGDLNELRAMVEGLAPEEVGVAFDIGHAIAVHGSGWRPLFERLSPYVRIAYVKDATRDRKWVPFGEGELAGSGYFKLLRNMAYRAPFSLHVEYDWRGGRENVGRDVLAAALRQSATTLRGWWAAAG